LWCFALLPRTWYARHGWRRALRLCSARMIRGPGTRGIVALALVGNAAIALVWWLGGARWEATFNAALGLAVGAAVIWFVRVFGSLALRREAMGFGDVTL